jgi:hypothetical protein
MPDLSLTRAEIDDLVGYIETLRCTSSAASQYDAPQLPRLPATYALYGFDPGCRWSRRLSTKAITSADCSGFRIRFGIFGCGVCRKARRAVVVIPGVLAILEIRPDCDNSL